MTGPEATVPPETPDIAYDAVVLAGGRAARLDGASKAGLVVGGTRLLDRALAASARARRVAVVGPPELAGTLSGPRSDSAPATGASGSSAASGRPGPRVVLTREDPPYGGPVAGLAAGLHSLPDPGSPWVLLLAVDVPHASEAIAALELAVSREPADGAYLVRDGRAQWLVGLYRRATLDALLDQMETEGASMKRLVGALRCVEVPDPAGWSDDIDTPADAARWGATPPASSGVTGTRQARSSIERKDST